MSLLSVAGAFVSSLATSVASVTSSVATGLSATISTLVSKGLEVVSQVSKVVGEVLKVMGVLQPEDEMEELGDKALQAKEQGITPDQFDQYNDYVETIRNFRLDPQVSADTKVEAKLAVAVGVGLSSLEKKLDMAEGSSSDMLRLIILSPDYFSSDRLEDLLNKGVDFTQVAKYFSGDLNLSERREIKAELFKTETSLNSQSGEQDHENNLRKVNDEVDERGL